MNKREIVVPDEYDDYRKDIKEISYLSTKENSILYDFRVKNDKIISNKIIMLKQNGEKKVLKSGKFEYYEDFYKSFMFPLVDSFSESNVINSEDYIEDKENESYTYRIITETNDLLSVSGITLSEVNRLREVVANGLENNNNKVLKYDFIKNDEGKIDFGIIFLCILCTVIIGFLVLLFI